MASKREGKKTGRTEKKMFVVVYFKKLIDHNHTLSLFPWLGGLNRLVTYIYSS
jgi:hypothetical protein